MIGTSGLTDRDGGMGSSAAAAIPETRRADLSQIILEWLFVAVIVGSLGYAALFYHKEGYLPPPFFPDPNDVWADGYNSSWWAFNGHMYDVWRTVYPPLTFALIKLFSTYSCYNGDAGYARDCDWGLWNAILAFYALNCFIVYFAYHRNEARTALPRMLALMLGLPMLYGFEHTNMLVIAWTGLFIASSPTFKSARLRWLGMAVAINLKPYFVALLLGQLVRRRWRWVEGALLITAVVWLISYVIIGAGSPQEVFGNIFLFQSSSDREANWWFVIYSTSYTSMVKFLNNSMTPVMPWIGSWRIEFGTVFFMTIVRMAQLASIAAIAAVWLKPQAVTQSRLASLCFLLILISVEPGGYTMAGAIFFVFFERWRGPGRITAIICGYILCLPLDVSIKYIGSRYWWGYVAQRVVYQDLWLTAGPFIRPAILVIMQLALVATTFADIRRRDRQLVGPPQGIDPPPPSPTGETGALPVALPSPTN